MANQATIERLNSAIPAVETREFRGQTRALVPPESLIGALRLLKEELSFDMLIDVTCVDYLAYRDAAGTFRVGLSAVEYRVG